MKEKLAHSASIGTDSAEQLARTSESTEIRFSKSKVRDDDGNLLVVHHFSDVEGIQRLDPSYCGGGTEGDEGFYGSGVYFTQFKEFSHHGRNRYDSFINLENPLIIRNPSIDDIKNLHGEQAALREQGYDGVMVWTDAIEEREVTLFGKKVRIPGRGEGWSEIVVFDADDIEIVGEEKSTEY